MLKVKGNLPAGAILGQSRGKFAATLDSSAVWLQGVPDAFLTNDDGGVLAWFNDDHKAKRTKPNDGNGRVADTGRPGLVCTPSVHCGVVLRDVTDHAARCTMAVIYTPDPEAESATLLTLNTHKRGNPNYVLLSDREEGIITKDTEGNVEASIPARPATGAPRMLVVTLSGSRIGLAVDLEDPIVNKGMTPGFDSPADLFIGCRSHRAGLKKTLGGAVLHEVLFWPNHTLLVPRTAEDEAQYVALKQFHLWGD